MENYYDLDLSLTLILTLMNKENDDSNLRVTNEICTES